MVKTRQSDLLMRMHLAFSSREYSEAALKMLSTNYKDYDEFVEKYGHIFAEGPVQTEFLMMGMFARAAIQDCHYQQQSMFCLHAYYFARPYFI